MSDKIAALRELALSRNAQLHPLHLILDDELRDELAAARSNLQAMLDERNKLAGEGNLPPQQPESLADDAPPAAHIDRMIVSAQEIVEAIQDEAAEAGSVLVLQFKRLAPAEYQVVIDKAERAAKKQARQDGETRTEGELFSLELNNTLTPACYVRAETVDGEDLGIDFDQLTANVWNHADVDEARNHCILINRKGNTAPFRLPNSGGPAKS